MTGVDPVLVRGWLAARSLARALPMPVDDHGGWRVDTGGAPERRRYVFARVTPGLDVVLNEVDAPGIYVKLCTDAATFRALLPPRWSITDANCMMVPDRPMQEPVTIPPAYRLTVATEAGVTRATIIAPDGMLAASGYAAEYEGVFVYDRIVVEDAHRRRGLGRALMIALGECCSATARPILTATAMGAALYRTLGWVVYTPYTTAAIVPPPGQWTTPDPRGSIGHCPPHVTGR